MASKVVILAAMMATLVVMTHATIITTEVEVEVEIEDTASDQRMSTSSQCRRELRSQWPNHCEQYMMQGMRRRSYMIDEDINQGKQSRQYFDKCCDDLRMMQPQCQCEAMKMMMQDMEMKQQGHMMMDKAMKIPMMCGTMQRQCPMSYI